MKTKHQRQLYQRHLEALHRGEADTAQQVAKSQKAIKDSRVLIQESDKQEVARKPETRCEHPEGRGLNTRPDRGP